MASRTRRVAIDGGFEQSGNRWYQASGSFQSFGDEDYVSFFLQYFDMHLGGNGTVVGAVTLWSAGLLSLGIATDAQVAFMKSGESPIPGVDGAGFPGEFFVFDYTEGAKHTVYSFGIGGADYAAPYLNSEEVHTAFFTFEDQYQIIVDENGFSIISEDGGAGSTTNGYYVGGLAFQTVGGEIEFEEFPDFFTYPGTAGADTVLGSQYNDFFLSGPGADSIDGGEGIDVVSYASSVAGVTIDLAGGTGSGGDAQGDTLNGIERIVGSESADTLIGNAGHDNVLEGGAGADVLDGGAGFDWVSYLGSGSGVTVSLAANTATGGDATGDTIANFENVYGSAFDDVLEGSDLANKLSGGAGDDTLVGLAGNDTLFAGDGDNLLVGGPGADWIYGGAGMDTASYADSPFAIAVNRSLGTMSGGDAAGDYLDYEVDGILGSAFGDTIIGGLYDERFDGGGGGDTLSGMGGGDTLRGGAGDDQLDGGTGFDTAEFSGDRSAYAWTVASGTTVISGPDGTDTLTGIERMQFASARYEIGVAGFAAPVLASPGFGSSVASGGWTGNDATPRMLADLDGDGGLDILGFGPGGTYVALGLGGGTFAAPILASAGYGSSAASGSWVSEAATPRELADIDGDGTLDLVGFAPGGVYVSLGNGNGTFAAPFVGTIGFGSSVASGGWTDSDTTPRMLADLDNDGHADIVGFGPGGTYVARGNADGTFAAPVLASAGYGSSAASGSWTSNAATPRLLADLNGDGFEDLVGFGAAGVYASLGVGDGTFAAPYLATGGFGSSAASGGWADADAQPRLLADLNGDGRADILGFGAGGTYGALANPDGTFGAAYLAHLGFGSSPGSGGWAGQNETPRRLADLDGDGILDLVGFAAGGVYAAYGDGAGGFGAPFLAHAGFGSSAASGGWAHDDTQPRLLPDLNNDGAADILGFGESGVITAVSVTDWLLA